MGCKNTVKILAQASGLLGAFHRTVNADTLTVVMFHRVLPVARWRDGDPAYTVSDRLFGQCLRFFRRYYAVVGIDDLVAAREGRRRLPRRALLVTFDDGWDDNLETAAPILAAEGVPAVVFVATDALTDARPAWWQEVLLRALRQGRADYRTLWERVPDAAPLPRPEDMLALLNRYAARDDREALLVPFAAGDEPRHMLTPERLVRLADAGVAIGSHGASHLPLTRLADPAADIARSRRVLADVLPNRARPVLSFPHGRQSPELQALAFDAGMAFVFTSDAVLNRLADGKAPAVLGRVEIPAAQIADGEGSLLPHRLATWLFLRPRCCLAGDGATARPGAPR